MNLNTIIIISKFYLYFLTLHFIQKNILKYILYNYTSVDSTKNVSISSHIISSLNAIIICYNSFMYLLGYFNFNEWYDMFLIIISYALFDLYIIFKNLELFPIWRTTVFHHFILLSSFFFTEYSKLLAILFLTETSTITLNNTWFLHTIDKKKNIFFKVNCYATLFLFFIFRIVIVFFSFIYNLKYNNTYLGSFIILLLWLLNIFWFKLLLNKSKEIE